MADRWALTLRTDESAGPVLQLLESPERYP